MSNWTEEVKRLWDEDTAAGRDVRVVILGSAPLLIARGLIEGLRQKVTDQSDFGGGRNLRPHTAQPGPHP